MNLACSIFVIIGNITAPATLDGVKLGQNESKYYVDFDKTLKDHPQWRLDNGGTKALVNKADCVVIK